MSTVEVTLQAYEILIQRAKETQHSPDEVASQMITDQAAATEHPYVERRSDVLSGKPTIKGTRIPIWQIAERLKLGDSPDDLLDAYPHLSAAAVYDAISFYFDHRVEIYGQIEDNQIENVLDRHQAVVDEQGRINPLSIAPRATAKYAVPPPPD